MREEKLINEDAKAKIKNLAEDIDIAMMETNLGNRPAHIVPMSTKDVDDEGCIWFLSNKNSDHNLNLDSDKSVQLIYSQPSKMEFMTIYGQAFITTDKNVLDRYYSTSDDTWFEGVDDPNLTAIKVIPEEAYYWDSQEGKFVSFLPL
ncbi:MAG TPA: pyridoxamine 5'-phosphate oxidase family protein [Pricia sp.]|nr:pyridoxamine 5'-phosphate oxidase family protein [Pricia sp.]